jgi:hypothetical protein
MITSAMLVSLLLESSVVFPSWAVTAGRTAAKPKIESDAATAANITLLFIDARNALFY